MLVAAAVVPGAPLLVPALAPGADDEQLAALREQVREAIATVVTSDAGVRYVVGADRGVHATTFGPWGAAVPAGVPEPLPLSLLVGGWLTRDVARSFVAVEAGFGTADCKETGAALAGSADRVALVVVGDGSARHTVKAPGYLDDRAAGWDAGVHAAFRAGDVDRIAALDVGLADELLVSGREAWQVLAGAADGAALTHFDATFSAPYGVGYHVATWT